MLLRVRYQPDDEGIIASIYSLPGCHVEGRTKEEARANLEQALREFFDDTSGIILEDEPS